MGDCVKRGLRQFANLRGGLAKRGGSVFKWGWYPNAHCVTLHFIYASEHRYASWKRIKLNKRWIDTYRCNLGLNPVDVRVTSFNLRHFWLFQSFLYDFIVEVYIFLLLNDREFVDRYWSYDLPVKSGCLRVGCIFNGKSCFSISNGL